MTRTGPCRRRAATLLAMIGLLLAPAMAAGHALAPMLLGVEDLGDGSYRLLWQRAPADAWAAAVRPQPSSGCRLRDGWREEVAAVSAGVRSLESRAVVHCAASALPLRLRVPGLDRHPGTVIASLSDADGGRHFVLLRGAQDQLTVETEATGSAEALLRYGKLGLQHLFGADHLLFLLGLFLLVAGARQLVAVSLAFTVGHSLTLALATLGLLQLPQALAELGIAVSLVALGWRALARPALPFAADIGWRLPAFGMGFGLLHGLGFAGALAEVGLPAQALLPALLGFNLGIEAGQLLVLLPLQALRRMLRAGAGRNPASPVPTRGGWRGGWAAVASPLFTLGAFLVGCAGVYWCIDRGLHIVGTI